MRFVIDSSVALSWCFPDEVTPLTTRFFELSRRSQLVVPPLWQIEVANVLGVNHRRGRVSSAWLDQVVATLGEFDIEVAMEPADATISTYLFDMQLHQLTAYDATYLVLAQHLKLPLATFDKEIIAAAQRVGVPLVHVLE